MFLFFSSLHLFAVCSQKFAWCWMKHPKVLTVGTSNPVNKSDKAWLIKGYEPWVYYRSVNSPFFESQQVDGMFADPPMTGSSAIASKILNDLPAKDFNEQS
jgi:hypothetical protein